MEDWLQRARDAWKFKGRERPPFAVEPGPGQESVWDYPRPPAVEPEPRRVRVELGGVVLAESSRAIRVLETASAPAIYLPPEDVAMEHLEAQSEGSICEWKGPWHYWTIVVGERRVPNGAWSYPEPFAGYEAIRDYISLYPGRVDLCRLGDEDVQPQPGGFYGGWVTQEIVGPMKGEPGTGGW